MNKYQALAISRMAEARHEYNLGVLAMLGKADLAIAHQTVYASAELIAQQLHAQIPGPETFADLLEMPDHLKPIQESLDDAIRRRDAAWAPIQVLIDEARNISDAVDSEFLP